MVPKNRAASELVLKVPLHITIHFFTDKCNLKDCQEIEWGLTFSNRGGGGRVLAELEECMR